MQRLILVLLLIFHISSNTCGGNCPSNTCTSCICGTSKSPSAPDCSKYTWDRNCCKCISTKVSQNNKHFMTQAFGFLEIGMFGISEDDYCTSRAYLCNHGDNTACAFEIYIESLKDWSYWDYEATACGCPTSDSVDAKWAERRRKVNALKVKLFGDPKQQGQITTE